MNNDPKNLASEAEADVTAHEFTPASMVAHLLQSGFTVDQIEGRIAAPMDFVKGCLSDSQPISSQPDQLMLMLKDLYLREQVKSFLRASPYLGMKKGAQRIGISLKEYEATYNGLIRAGEVKFVIDTPDWGDVGSKKIPLRKHIVK